MRNAKQFRDMAWHVLKNRYWWAVLAALIAIALGGGLAGVYRYNLDFSEWENWGEGLQQARVVYSGLQFFTGFMMGLLGTAFALAFLFVGANVELGYDLYHIRQYEIAEAPPIGTLFSRFSIFWRAVGLRLLIMLKVFLWSLLFVVPGIVAAYRYALAPYILAENPEISAKEAIERSKALMQGHKARLFRLGLSFIGWLLLAGLTAGIGFVFLAPYMKTAFTGFYLERVGRLPLPGEPATEQPQQPQQPQPPQSEPAADDHVEMI